MPHKTLPATAAAISICAAHLALAQSSDCAHNGEVMTQSKYASYVGLFNAHDEHFADYYDEHILFDHGDTGGILRGRQAVLDLYRRFWGQLDETVYTYRVVIDNDGGAMAVELTTDLKAKRDTVGLPGIVMKKGERLVLKEMVLYGLCNGKITWIRGPFSGEYKFPAR